MPRVKRLRSDIFADYRGLKAEFFQDVTTLAELTPRQKSALLSGIPSVFDADTDMERRIAQDALVASMGGDKTKALRAIAVVVYLYAKWDPAHDTTQGVLADLEDIGALTTGAKAREHKSFMKQLLSLIDRRSSIRRREQYEGAAIPDLIGVEAVVDFRAVLTSPYSWSTQTAKEYKPVVESMVPVVVMKLSMSGDKHSVVLQVDEKTLGRLQERLTASVKEVAAASRFMKQNQR